MAQGGYDLKDDNPGPIRFYCPACHRWAQQQRDKLIEQFGVDQSMPDLLTKAPAMWQAQQLRRPVQADLLGRDG